MLLFRGTPAQSVGMANRTKLTPKKRALFLQSLVETGGHVTASCRAIGMTKQRLYEIRAKDTDFASEWDAAVEEGTENLEKEAFRRAYEGTCKPVYQGGQYVGDVQEYSDTLMIFLLKGRRPAVYRDQAVVEHNHTGALTVDATLAGLSTQALEKIEAILAAEAELQAPVTE